MTGLRLLAGPDLGAGPEGYADHVRRLGQPTLAGRALIEALVRSGLTGRGGASFPAGLKWRALASSSKGSAVIVVNGAEGEPQSHEAERRITRMAAAPHRYVAGESSAAVHLIDAGIATPTTTPPYSREQGVAAAPTLMQNVETLAHIALIARYGDAWYRSAGRRGAVGTLLVTIAGGVAKPGVLEIEAGTTIAEAVAMCGGLSGPASAVLLGGYFGNWLPAAKAWDLPLDAEALRAGGVGLGCGVIGLQPAGRCGVCDTARIMRYLAEESSAQCGPCFFGLRALSDACNRVAERGTNHDDMARLKRWAVEVEGRGACKHPDGAVMFLRSALSTFADEFASHPAHWRQQPA